MADYFTQVTLEHDSALPEDRAVNTFSAQIDVTNELVNIAAWHSALETFYLAIDTYLSSSLSGAGTIKTYRRSDPSPRVPVVTTPITITPSTAMMPAEVAVCISFQGVRLAGANQARRRGRIFVGPLGANSLDSATGRPAAALITSFVTAADALVTASKAAADWSWGVWSTVNNDDTDVDNGWVDNSFDTQRRRGIRPTSRSLFS